tara:strand:+ start:3023 stop:3265 length:243 start_codon:yes stop_codon:yes gene_type:complete
MNKPKIISEAVNNKINMVRDVFHRKRYYDLQEEIIRSRYIRSTRDPSDRSEEVHLYVDSERMTDYVNALNWMTKNGNQKR